MLILHLTTSQSQAMQEAMEEAIKAASAGPHQNVEDLRLSSSPHQANDPKGEYAGRIESKRFVPVPVPVPVPRPRIQLTAS